MTVTLPDQCPTLHVNLLEGSAHVYLELEADDVMSAALVITASPLLDARVSGLYLLIRFNNSYWKHTLPLSIVFRTPQVGLCES